MQTHAQPEHQPRFDVSEDDRVRADDGLRLALDSIPALVHSAQPDGSLDYFNKRWLDYLGVSFDDIKGWGWTSKIHPEDIDGLLEKWRSSLRTGEPFESEARVRRANGEFRWMLHQKVAVRDAGGNIIKWYGSSIDIEERKRTELLLKEGQRLLYVGSWAFGPAGFDQWSSELFKIHGLEPSAKAPSLEEYLALVHPEDREFVSQTVQKMFAEGGRFDFTKRIVRPDGEIRRVRCVGIPATNGGTFQGFVGTGIDVTEQDRILEELKRSEFYLAEGQRLGHAGSWSFKPDLTCDYWSRELYEILGFDPNGGIPTISDYFTRVHPEDRKVVEATIQRMIAAGEGCDLKKRIIRPDGMQRVIHCVGMPVRENGVVVRFVGTLMDITDQEELTQELRRREAYLAEAQRLSHIGSFGWNVVTGELTWSEENYRILGYDRSVKPTFELIRERVHPDDHQIWQEANARAAEGKEVDFEHRLLMPDGSVKHLHVVAYGVHKDGKFAELIGTARDVTERKRAEEAVRRSEAYLAEAQRLNKTGSFAWSPATDNTYFSEECYRVLGFEPQGDLPPKLETIFERIHPDDHAHCRELIEKAIRDKVDVEIDYRIVHPDKRVRDIHCVSHVVLDRSGELVEIVGTVIDVTERKSAVEVIRRSEAFLAEGQRLSHTGSWGWNASTGKVTWSQEHFRILGLDPQDTNPSLDIFWERVHPDDRTALRRTFESAVKEKRNFEQEFRIVTPDWSIKHLHGVGHAIVNEANELVEFIGSTMDITEHKRAEERTQSQREAIRLALNAFVEELDVDRFLADVIAELNKQFHAKSWELWLFDEALTELSLHLSSQPGDSRSPGVGDRNYRRLEELTCIWQSKSFARAPQVFELPTQGPTLGLQYFESLDAQGVKTLLIVPLALGEQNLGFLELHFQSSKQFTPVDLELAQALVNHATLALQLNRLAHRAGQLAVTEERNRLARDIHDTLAQAFAGIVLHSEALGPSLAVSKRRSMKSLSQILKLARSGLDEARRSVQALRPKALEDRTLSEALKHAAKRLSEGGTLACHFRQQGETRMLSLESQNELFRIAQEALTNVNKHAQANSIRINLAYSARQVSLTIRDNGVGMKATTSAEPKQGYGLGTMRERAQRVGGQLEIQSPESGGTCVRVRVPLATTDKPIKSNQHP